MKYSMGDLTLRNGLIRGRGSGRFRSTRRFGGEYFDGVL